MKLEFGSTTVNKSVIKIDQSAAIARLVEFGKRHTLREVGEKMGVTRERVRQIEAQALSRLRNPSVLHKLRGYLGSN